VELVSVISELTLVGEKYGCKNFLVNLLTLIVTDSLQIDDTTKLNCPHFISMIGGKFSSLCSKFNYKTVRMWNLLGLIELAISYDFKGSTRLQKQSNHLRVLVHSGHY